MVKISKKHLLVIGGTGFIGSHLVQKAKEKNWQVTSISLNKPKKKIIPGVNYLKIDITKKNIIKKKLKKKYDYVVNLGGYINHSNSKEVEKQHFYAVRNLEQVLLKKKIKSFVQIGSSDEYGQSISPQNEKTLEQPISIYSLSKLYSTYYLLNSYKENNFPVVILRLFLVYGPGQKKNRLIPQTIKGCIDNKKFFASKGDQIRDLCYIDDVVKVIFLVLNSKRCQGKIFNIGSGKPVKIKYLIKFIRKLIGRGKPQFGKINYRYNENMSLYANIKKIKKFTNWKPKISLKKGLLKTIDSLKN